LEASGLIGPQSSGTPSTSALADFNRRVPQVMAVPEGMAPKGWQSRRGMAIPEGKAATRPVTKVEGSPREL